MKGNIQIGIALLIILFVVVLDLFYFEPDRTPHSLSDIFLVMEEGHPKFSLDYIIRTVLLALSSLLMVVYIVTHPSSRWTKHKIIEDDSFSGWGKIVWIKDGSANMNSSKRIKKLIL